MGATNVKYTIDGYSATEVFNELKDKYIEEYGNNGYKKNSKVETI